MGFGRGDLTRTSRTWRLQSEGEWKDNRLAFYRSTLCVCPIIYIQCFSAGGLAFVFWPRASVTAVVTIHNANCAELMVKLFFLVLYGLGRGNTQSWLHLLGLMSDQSTLEVNATNWPCTRKLWKDNACDGTQRTGGGAF